MFALFLKMPTFQQYLVTVVQMEIITLISFTVRLILKTSKIKSHGERKA